MILDGNKIDFLLVNKGMDADTFSKDSGICKTTVYDILKGKNISRKTAIKVSKFFGVQIEELVKGDE